MLLSWLLSVIGFTKCTFSALVILVYWISENFHATSDLEEEPVPALSNGTNEVEDVEMGQFDDVDQPEM